MRPPEARRLFGQKVYSADPVAVAKEFERQGAGMLHIVDLDGAKTGRPANTEIIRAIKNAVAIPVEVGGGIRSAAVAKEYLAFADRIVLGTKALEDIPFVEGVDTRVWQQAHRRGTGVERRESGDRRVAADARGVIFATPRKS